MFRIIKRSEFSTETALVSKFYQLRKRVFADQLGWDVPTHGDLERDDYDDLDCTYLLWCNDDETQLYAGVRLMQTTGPTLLHDVFYATHGRNPELISKSVYEGTRMCVDDAAIARDFPALEAGRAFSMLFVALCEASLALGIARLVSNFEACMSRIYRRAGLKMDLHGSADGYGKRPVYCASFEVSHDVLAQMRCKLGIELPLLQPAPQIQQPAPAARALEAA